MKKILSVILALMMVLGMMVSTAIAEDAQPAAEPASEAKYVALGLNIKNKTGVTINELYIYPAGADKGNSVVAPGWKDKDADPEGYEKNIYIVRPEGAEMEVLAVFEDGTNATWQVGPLAMYDKLSMKNGTDVAKWEHEPNDDEADKALMDKVVAIGKTADHTYPGYVEVAAEVKNKTGKNIVEFYLYEEGGDPKAYNNMVEYMYSADGTQFTMWSPGKAKEGGKYIFSFFLRPQADNYMIDLVYDDGTTVTGPVDDWFKPDGDGHQLNEISLKDAADPDQWKIAWDDGTDDDFGMPMDERLAYEINTIGVPADGWYPVYEGAPEATEESKAALIELVKAAVPFAAGTEAPAAEAAPAEGAPAAEAAAVPEGYTGIAMLIKNKTGKDIAKIYLYPVGEDKGKNVFKTLAEVLPTEDETKEGKPHEIYVYVLRETEKLGAMELRVRFVDETLEELTWQLPEALATNSTITLKEAVEDWKLKATDDADDLAAQNELATKGEPTDGIMP